MRTPPDEDDQRLYQAVGSRIASARAAAGFSQGELGRRCRLTRGSVANIEAGRQHAPMPTIWRIARALDIEPRLLLPSRAEFDDAPPPDVAAGSPEATRMAAELPRARSFIQAHRRTQEQDKHATETRSRAPNQQRSDRDRG